MQSKWVYMYTIGLTKMSYLCILGSVYILEHILWSLSTECSSTVLSCWFFFYSPSLLVTHLKFQAHADISHNELVLVQVDAKLMKGEVDARGGVIAGSILMEDTQVHGTKNSFSIM